MRSTQQYQLRSDGDGRRGRSILGTRSAPTGLVDAPSPSAPSPPARALRLSIAFALSACLHRASAFATPPRQANEAVAASKPRRDAYPTTLPPSIQSASRRHHFVDYTMLLVKSAHDDGEAGESSVSKQIPRAMNKGTQRFERTSNPPNAKAKSSSKRKAKGTSRRPQKQTPKRKSKETKRSSKKPVEISNRSLSSSQTKSRQIPMQALQPSEDTTGGENHAYEIPKTGYSLADQLEKSSPENRERFETKLTPIVAGIRDQKEGRGEVEFEYDEDGFPLSFREIGGGSEGEGSSRRHEGVARIDTVSTLGNAGEEPVRWLVSLGEAGDAEEGSFAMIDLPPYSDKLADEIRSFMDPSYNATNFESGGNDGGIDDGSNDDQMKEATLDAILLTNRECIHYDASPAVYVTRKSDLTKWKTAFPTAEVVMYRLDVPRVCREEVTQVLDGYGPWGWEEGTAGHESGVRRCGKFVETGRPLTIQEWGDDTMAKVLTKGEFPPDDQTSGDEGALSDGGDVMDGDNPLYSPEAVREREEQHRLLAVYTPGHTFGSVTYVFPRRGICCSGYALPLESASGTAADNPEGPRIDYRGYLAASASRPRQMSSALSLIDGYVDRFRAVLPARGDVTFLDPDEDRRRRELMERVGLYRKIGDIYSRLGIVEK